MIFSENTKHFRFIPIPVIKILYHECTIISHHSSLTRTSGASRTTGLESCFTTAQYRYACVRACAVYHCRCRPLRSKFQRKKAKAKNERNDYTTERHIIIMIGRSLHRHSKDLFPPYLYHIWWIFIPHRAREIQR